MTECNDPAVFQQALESVCRLHRIEVCRMNLDVARERYNRAGAEIDLWELRLKIAEAESRGLNEPS